MINLKKVSAWAGAILLATANAAFASEMDLKVPSLDVAYDIFGYSITGSQILLYGLGLCAFGMLFGLCEFFGIKKLPAHESMLKVSETIYATCTTYMKQQAKLLFVLELFIGACIVYYFAGLNNTPWSKVAYILLWSILGILGSFTVAWFGMRINTYANSRTSFASLKGQAYPVMHLPLRSGMSIGVLLICVELLVMLFILVYVPRDLAGACFIGFAIGESLGASALRICGGIFTKIADIGADLMKIIFKIDEDDARNPGVIADCTGDNAGDSCGPTADGFETYGVTGVALISFIVLAAGYHWTADGGLAQYVYAPELQARLITWIFAMRILMIMTSVVAYGLNGFFSKLIIAWIGPAASHARKTDYYGSYGLQYHYQVNSWCRVGAKFNWEGEDYDMWTGKKDDASAVKKGVTFGHTLSLVASAQFTYFNREHVQIYSGLDAGVGTYISDVKYLPGYADSDGNTHPVKATWLPAFNITPIGVAFGSWRVFGFVETNIGYEAFVKVGLGVHF